jgi:predicted nucleic acid-binding Zn ribbon protein
LNTITCRDCGYSLQSDARGCPQCALNLEIERRIDQVVKWILLPSLILVLILIAYAWYLMG